MNDAVVIGVGLAGLTAAVRMAEGGARVLVLAKGVGATHLGPCTIDVLGYAPERIERPGEALAGLGEDHPYAAVGRDGVAAGWAPGRGRPSLGGLPGPLVAAGRAGLDGAAQPPVQGRDRRRRAHPRHLPAASRRR